MDKNEIKEKVKDFLREKYTVCVLFIFLATFYVYALFHIFIEDSVHIWEQDGILFFFLIGIVLLYGAALFAIFWYSLLNRSKEDKTTIAKPIVTHNLTDEGECMLAVIQELDQLLVDNKKANVKISKLVIPVPEKLESGNMTPFVDYIKELSELPGAISEITDEPTRKSETIVTPMEQFMYSMCQATHFDKFSPNLISAMGKLSEAKNIIADNFKDDMIRYGHDMNHFFHHLGDTDAWTNILNGTANQLEHSANSTFTIARGLMKKTTKESGKFAAQTAGMDGIKGFFSAFIDDETWQHVHNIEDLAVSAAKEFAEGLVPTIDLDIWHPDFDLGGHFPLVKVGVEGLNLIKKGEQGDVNMMKALQNSATRVGGAWGGATLGLAIGTLICPGVGTVLGPMIGGWLGNLSANAVIVEAVKEKQERLKKWIDELHILGKQAQENIENCQNETAQEITEVSTEQANNLREMKDCDPVNEDEAYPIYMSVGIMLKDYIKSFIEELKTSDAVSYYQEKNALESFLPTTNQLKTYPKESIQLLLSAQSYIQERFTENQYSNFSLSINTTMESATSSLILMKYLKVIWLTEIYSTYSNGVNELLTVANKKFGELQTVCMTEKAKVENKRRDCENLARNIEESVKAI